MRTKNSHLATLGKALSEALENVTRKFFFQNARGDVPTSDV